jgi:hypothetical protein
MAITITPTSGAPGTVLAIAGDFGETPAVSFGSGSRETLASPFLVIPGEIHVVVPAFDGREVDLTVEVVTADGSRSESAVFHLGAWPPIEEVYPLCSLAMLKELLGVGADDTGMDDTYRRMILGASACIQGQRGMCQFRLLERIDGLYDGDGTEELRLPDTPIVSVSAIAIDGESVDPAELAIYTHHIAWKTNGEYEPRLRSFGRVFPAGRQNIRISHRYGYAQVPGEIALACVAQVVQIQNTLAKQGIVAESNSVSGSSTTYAQVPLAPAAMRAINRYRRPRVGVV